MGLRRRLWFGVLAMLAPAPAWAGEAPAFETTDRYEVRKVEGWTVLVNREFLEGRPGLAARTLDLLRSQLVQVVHKVPAYAAENHKEDFAEASEAFFGANDFYPFVRVELRRHDPEMEALLGRLWGVR